MQVIVVAGCLECGAIGDIDVEELTSAPCYNCRKTNFMADSSRDMSLEFIEKFFAARLEKMMIY